MGETPMQGEAFTYLIEADPLQWQTQGQVIQLVQVSTDQPQEVFLPVLSPTLHIGKGSPTSLAVSPDGQWMAVSTQLGVYLYHASTFAESWFVPLPEKAGSVISTEGPFPNSTSDILILPEIPMALENKQKDGAKRD